MRLPAWPRRFRSRRQRPRDVVRERLMEPVQLSFRRLEERRVLDVGATFIAATGELDLQLTGHAEAATISAQNGNIVVTDANQQIVTIQDENSQATTVGVSDVRSLAVTGDQAADQAVHLETPLAPFNGVSIDASVELATINGDLTRIADSDVTLSAAEIKLAADISATSSLILFEGNVELGADVQLSAESIIFAGTLDDDGDSSTGSALDLNATGLARFLAEVGGQSPIDRLVTDAAGHTELNSDISASGGTLIFNDPVVLTSSVSLSDSGPTGIRFNSTVDSEVDGQHDLELTATAGRITFSGDVGNGAAGDQSLGSLTVHSAAGGVVFGEKFGIAHVRTDGDINLGSVAGGIGGVGIVFNGDGGAVATTPLLTISTNGGDVRLNGAAVLESNLLVATNGGNVVTTADAPIDSGVNVTRMLTLDAGSGAVLINEDIGRRTALGGLTVITADGGVIFGQADTEVSGTASLGPVALIATTGPIDLGSGTNVLGGLSFNAGDGNTLVVKTTGDQVRLNGAVRLDSHLQIDTGANAGDVVFTADASINSQADESNDLTLHAGAGAVLMNANLGADHALGQLRVLRADAGVTIGEADSKSGPGGQGPVTLIRTTGPIDLGVGSSRILGTGITLNASSVPLVVESEGDQIRLNGQLTLASDVSISTGADQGDIVFTNDTPVDSAAGEMNSLHLNAGLGSVRINEDLGANALLGSLTVEQADGGVLFGEAISETVGAGERGPVDQIRVQGPIDIGVGANVIQGAGIVLTGGAISGMRISTVGNDVRFNGQTGLGNSVRIETGVSGGDIKFTHDAPIDSLPGRTSDLSLVAGTGRVSLNQNIGANQALGALLIRRADSGVQFGGATTGVLNTGGMGPLQIVHARRGIDVGVGLNVIAGAGIEINGGDASVVFRSDNNAIRFNGAIELQSSASFDSSAGLGDVIFTSATTIDSSDGPELATAIERNSLTVDAGLGQAAFNANLGGSQRLDRLIVERAVGGVVFGGADVPVAGAAGPVTLIATDGEIDLGAGNTNADMISGGIVFNGGADPLVLTTSADTVRLNGPVTAASKLSIQTNDGNLLLTTVASLNSQAGELNDVMLDLGGGDATLNAQVGSLQRLGEIQIVTAADVSLDESIVASRIAQLAGTGTTTFGGAIDTNDPNRIGVELTGTRFTFNAPLVASGDGRVSIRQTELLDINDAANMHLQGAFTQAGGNVEIAADIRTSGDVIALGGAVTLTDGPAADVHLDTTADGIATGAMISLGMTLNGQSDSAETIHFNSGTAHDLEVNSAIGTTQRVQTVRVIQARDVTFNGQVTVGNLAQAAGQGTTTLAGPLDANSPSEKAVDLTSRNVSLLETVMTQGDGRVEISVSGLLDIGVNADLTLSGAFQQRGGGETRLSADIMTSDAQIRFTDAVILREDVALDTGAGGGDIVFLSSLNGLIECGQHPTFASGAGDQLFAGPVGDLTAIGDLLILNAHDVAFDAALRVNSLSQQAGSGLTTFAGPVLVKGAAGLDLTTAALRFAGEVDSRPGNGPVHVSATADIAVDGRLATGSGTVTLMADNDVTMNPAGQILTNDAAVTITADADDTGTGALLMADGATIRSGAAAIRLTAGGDILLGSLITDNLVSLLTTGGAIVDGGEADVFDIIADRVALAARNGIGRDNPIDMQVNSVAARNQEAGGVRFDNRTGGLLTITTVDGLVGIHAGPVQAANLGGDIEISNVGTIDVNAAIENNAGGHTIVRAEIPGNLNVNQPIQNRGGDGWILLFAGEDLVINDSLPEFIGGDPTQPFPEAEISVQNEGAIRGQARGKVIVDDSETDYVIIRTHAERFPDAAILPTLPDKFLDPADFPEDDPAFYAELDAALAAQRNAVSAQVTNVAPIFSIESVDQGGSNLDERARGILKITIGDEFHLERNFHVTVDWGDGNIENYTIPGNLRASDGFILADGMRNNLSPDATITASFDAGELLPDGTRMPGMYFIHHTYIQPPDLADPAAPIPVVAEIRYDARPEGERSLDIIPPADGSEIFNGIRFFENLTQEIFSVDFEVMTNPGGGAFAFIKVFESEIIPVESRQVVTAVVTSNTVTATSAFGEQVDFVTAQFEAQSFGDYRLFYRLVDDVFKREFGEFNLPNARLSDPIGVFIKDFPFPNGHYRMYLEDVRTKRTRMILEVHIYEGKVVPSNFRQGATERQPGSDAVEKQDPNPAPGVNEGAAHRVDRMPARMDVNLTADAVVTPAISPEHDAQSASAAAAAAAACLASQPGLRRRLKRTASLQRRLDKTARVVRRLREKFQF